MGKVLCLVGLVLLLATGMAFAGATNYYGSASSGAFVSGSPIYGGTANQYGVYGGGSQTGSTGGYLGGFITSNGGAIYGGGVFVKSNPQGMTGTIVRSSSFSKVFVWSGQSQNPN